MRAETLPKPLDLPAERTGIDIRLACTEYETKFVIEMGGAGFEARRTLDRADLLDIKDWINEQLGGDCVMRASPILSAQVGMLADTLATAAAAPVVGMGAIVSDFGRQSETRLRALGNASRAIADATSAGRQYYLGVSASDFAVLKAFVAFADSEFALSGVCRPDDAVDQPFSPDESHFRDLERL